MKKDRGHIYKIIGQATGVSIEDICENTSLIYDLHADSMMLTEIIYNMEDLFSIKLTDEDIEKMDTVGDVIDLVDLAVRNRTRRT